MPSTPHDPAADDVTYAAGVSIDAVQAASHELLTAVRELSSQARRRVGVLPESVPTHPPDDEVRTHAFEKSIKKKKNENENASQHFA